MPALTGSFSLSFEFGRGENQTPVPTGLVFILNQTYTPPSGDNLAFVLNEGPYTPPAG